MKTKIKILCLVLAITLPTNLTGQTVNFEWAKQMGGTNCNAGGQSISTDAAGNIYTAGTFDGTADFDPGPGINNLTSVGNDIFIQKLDATGTLLWVKQIEGSGSEVLFSSTTDALGNVYATGSFTGTADFDPGPGTYNLTSVSGSDIYILKLDASGNLLWAKSMGAVTIFGDFATSITTDLAGNVYTTGKFGGTVDFDPGTGTTNITSTGDGDAFILKLDANGNFLWVGQLGGTGTDRGNSITTDLAGNVYTTGDFAGTADFDPGADTFNLTSAGSGDIFIQKLDSVGNFLWVKQMGGTNFESGNSITTDLAGNVYTTGLFIGTTDFDPGAATFNLTSAGDSDIFIQKLDASGNLLWVKQVAGPGTNRGHSITTDTTGSVYTTGKFRGTADFDPGVGTTNLTSAGSDDIFIQKLDASGNLLWVTRMGAVTGSDIGNSIITNLAGNVFTTGSFEGAVDFDPGSGTTILTAAGIIDIFIHKLSQIPVGIIENDFDAELLVYPNPTDGDFSIDLGANFKAVTTTITDLSGKIIQSQVYYNSQLLTLNLKVPTGVYLLLVESENKKAIIRVVKE